MPVLTEEEIAVLKLVMVDPVKPSDALLGVARCLLDTLDAKDERIKELEEERRLLHIMLWLRGRDQTTRLNYRAKLRHLFPAGFEEEVYTRAANLVEQALGERS